MTMNVRQLESAVMEIIDRQTRFEDEFSELQPTIGDIPAMPNDNSRQIYWANFDSLTTIGTAYTDLDMFVQKADGIYTTASSVVTIDDNVNTQGSRFKVDASASFDIKTSTVAETSQEIEFAIATDSTTIIDLEVASGWITDGTSTGDFAGPTIATVNIGVTAFYELGDGTGSSTTLKLVAKKANAESTVENVTATWTILQVEKS